MCGGGVAVNVVFFGSSSFSVAPLRALAAARGHELVGVVAQPDRPRGRNRRVEPGPVVAEAGRLGIPLMTPERIGSVEARATLAAWGPEVVIVASYGQYIPTTVLAIPPRGTVNIHPSLLPKYRGAAPLQWSIARGETVSGVTLFRVVKEMDAGDILLQEEHAILPGETAEELSARFSVIGARMAVACLDGLAAGGLAARPQDHAAATLAPKITLADAALDWTRPAAELAGRIRGFQPWPGCYFVADGRRIKVWRAAVEPGSGAPGTLLGVRPPGPLVACGSGALRLLALQPEGKKTMDGAAFLCGQRWVEGGILAPRSAESEESTL
jgi:methionyl-tRNA formyltransferase